MYKLNRYGKSGYVPKNRREKLPCQDPTGKFILMPERFLLIFSLHTMQSMNLHRHFSEKISIAEADNVCLRRSSQEYNLGEKPKYPDATLYEKINMINRIEKEETESNFYVQNIHLC